MSSKMNVLCAVPSCCSISTTSPKVQRWFSIPDYTALTSYKKDGKTVYYSKRKLWIDNLGLVDNCVAKKAVICPLHFRKQDLIYSDDGSISLKDDAIPRPILRTGSVTVNLKQNPNKNEDETKEKSDDDDDVEIIEPHRETITLDDDEEDESQKAISTSESNSDNEENESSIPEYPNSTPEQNSENKDSETSNKIQEKDSNSTSTCSSDEAVTNSVEDVSKKQTNSPTSEVNSLLERLLNKNQDTVTPKEENLNLNLMNVTLDGGKVMVHIPKPSSSSTSPNPAAKKSGNTPDNSKINSRKENQNTAVKDTSGPVIQTFSDSMKQQISLLLKNRDKMPVFKSTTPGIKMIQVFNLPKNLALNNLKSPQSNNSATDLSNVVAKVIVPPPKKDAVRVADGYVVKSVNDTQIYYPRQKILQLNTDGKPKKRVQAGAKKELASAKKELATAKKELTTREIGTQTDDEQVGFVEMYKFIKNHMIDFTLDAFGQLYMLKECTLNFESPSLGRKWDKKVACVSQSTLSSNDSLLLGAMHISIGFETNNESPEFNGYTKEVQSKTEKITRLLEPPKNSTEKINKLPEQTKNSEEKPNEKPESPPKKKKENSLESPTLVKLSKHKKAEMEQLLDRHKKRLIQKKKTLLKTSLARPKKVSRLPVSQMNPSVSGRLNMDRNRFKKIKKTVHDIDKKKRLLESLDNEKPKEDDINASTSDDKDPLGENVTQGSSEEDTKTRCKTRGKKTDYRRLSEKGTTEDVKTMPTKRKKTTPKVAKEKKAKYSDKVGAIESFLEVVLEPDNNDFNHDLEEGEKEDTDDFYMKPDPLALVD